MRRAFATPTRRAVATLAASAILIVLALQFGCGVNKGAFAPLATPSTGAVISGTAHAQGGGALQGVVVTLEAIDGGVSASVYRAIRAHDPTAPALAARSVRAGDRLQVDAVSRSTVTDAHGKFAFPGIPSGAYLLTGSARNHLAGIVRTTVKPLASTAAETTIVDIAMMPTGKFYGTVTLENATNHQSTIVYVDGSSYLAVTNPSGAYTIDGVPVGNWTVRGTHPGYLDRSTTGAIAAAGDSLPLATFQLPLNSNIAPTAAANAPTSPVAHTLTGLSGTGSDADGSIVRYEWDFTNDGTFDTTSPSTASTTHDYGTVGTYTAKLRVTDNDGAIGLSVVSVNVVDGVFISAAGNDGNPGTYDQPVATLSNGFAIASIFSRKYIYIATGTYNETPFFPVGTEVRGGMTTGTTWTQTLGNYSIVNVGTSPAVISGASSAMLVSGLDIRASNQVTPGATSIALSISNSTSALLLTDCKFTAGNGVGGASKSPGANGGAASGAAGQAGGIGGSPGGGNGGTGGVGGNGGGTGGPGGPNLGCNGPGFGGSTFQCANGGSGQNGFNSCTPVDGANGATLPNSGQTVSGVWNPAAGNNGANGTGGAGGGGGGGGGNTTTGLFCGNNGNGGNGAGGGGGGGFGTGGAGGNGGGASFAVYLYNALPTFTLCYFTSKNGGNGGNGGSGGFFGNGAGGGNGVAGTGAPNVGGTGGNGAAGIRGGGGGAGGGGAGGITACVANAGASGGSYDSNSFTTGLPGNGGTGGTHPVTFVVAPTGPTGTASQTVNLPGN